MPEQNNNQDLSSRLAEKSIKTMEKHVEEQTSQRLQSGQSPTEILQGLLGAVGKPDIQGTYNQINQLASTQIPIPGTMKGPSALMDLFKGQGFNPLAPHTQPLGMDVAIALTKLASEQAKMPGEMQKTNIDVISGLLKYAKDTGNKELFTALSGQQIPETSIEVNPMTGEPTAKGIGQKTTAEVTAKEESAKAIKQKEFSKELNNYFAVGDLLPTSEGLSRFQKGFELFGKGFLQSDVVGAAAADLNKINKRLRVKLVRNAGDVGNLNVVEQKAAEQLLYNLNDSTKLRELKKAYLQDLEGSVANEDQTRVKQLITSWIEQPGFKEKNPELYKSYAKQNYKKIGGKSEEGKQSDFSKMTTEQLKARLAQIKSGAK